MSKCITDTCVRASTAKGYCTKHYQQVKRHGKTIPTYYESRLAIIEGDIAKLALGIEARQGYAIVDKEYAFLDKYKWSLSTMGYPTTTINGVTRLFHHLLMDKKSGYIVDHKNGDKLDNRMSELRYVTYGQNTWNCRKSKNNTSGYIGVKWNKLNQNWNAKIHHEGKHIHIGVYATANEAAQAYNQAALKYRGEYAVLNETDE